MFKSLLVILIVTLLTVDTYAKISNAVERNGYVYMYDENGKKTGYSIMLGSSKELTGFNSKYIILSTKDNSYAYIYDEFGKNTGYSIRLGNSMYVQTVTESAIIVKDKSFLKFYDFTGKLLRSQRAD